MGTSGKGDLGWKCEGDAQPHNQGLGGGNLEKAESEPGPDTQPLLLHCCPPASISGITDDLWIILPWPGP